MNRGAVASWLFRLCVAIDLATLYILTFSLKYTLSDGSHYTATLLLNVLRAAIITLFVIDIASSGAANSRTRKAIDVFVVLGWAAILASLVVNSLRTGIW